MRINIRNLRFSLPDNPFGQNLERVITITKEAQQIKRKAGISNSKFKSILRDLLIVVHNKGDLEGALDSPLRVRALAMAFNTEFEGHIDLSQGVLRKILQIRKKPGALIVESVLTHYLKHYDQLRDLKAVESWLLVAMTERNTLTPEYIHLLQGDGPKWLAEECRKNNCDFDQQLTHMKLGRYASGRFMTVAKNIYYLDELRELEPNQDHPILLEMQKKMAYESRYDEHSLLGHEILRVLIDKAPISGIGDAWLNVVFAIAGDPRVPRSHPKYQKWWSQLAPRLKDKVEGWLSELDLRLFLEALENFSCQPGNDKLKRMFKSRKRFMEGILEEKLVVRTQLYLSYYAESYLRQNYRPEHLPSFSSVTDGDRSLIYLDLGNAHMIEGSHNCKLWIYSQLDNSAIVRNRSKTRVSYDSLTNGLAREMAIKGFPPEAGIRHTPTSFSWQNDALDALNKIGVPLKAKDVLVPEDYRKYKRMYGA